LGVLWDKVTGVTRHNIYAASEKDFLASQTSALRSKGYTTNDVGGNINVSDIYNKDWDIVVVVSAENSCGEGRMSTPVYIKP